MGNGYEHHHYFHRKTIFFPIFCRLSIKDDIKINKLDQHQISDDIHEPSSPKVSCMGQVKRNNRITGFPSTTTTTVAVATHHHKYSKLRKLFSSKALLPHTITTSLPTITKSKSSSTCTSSKEIMSLCVDTKLKRLKLKNDHGDHHKWDDQDNCHVVKVVNVKEFDPPLPVVKRVAPPHGAEVNIWKRRFNGVALKGLQIEQIIHN